ncbi:MAG: hypothetical protein ACK5XV_13220 [Flavobacteriales bacterium]
MKQINLKTRSRGVSSLMVIMLSIYTPAFTQDFTITPPGEEGKIGLMDVHGQLLVPRKCVSIVPPPKNNFLVYQENPGWPMMPDYQSEK